MNYVSTLIYHRQKQSQNQLYQFCGKTSSIWNQRFNQIFWHGHYFLLNTVNQRGCSNRTKYGQKLGYLLRIKKVVGRYILDIIYEPPIHRVFILCNLFLLFCWLSSGMFWEDFKLVDILLLEMLIGLLFLWAHQWP